MADPLVATPPEPPMPPAPPLPPGSSDAPTWIKPVVGCAVLGVWAAMHVLAFFKASADLNLHDLEVFDSALVGSVVYFYFGSSSGEHTAHATIASQLPPASPPVPPAPPKPPVEQPPAQGAK